MVCGIMVKEHIPTLIMCSEAESVCNIGRCVCVCIKYSYNGCDIVCYTGYITHAHAHTLNFVSMHLWISYFQLGIPKMLDKFAA